MSSGQKFVARNRAPRVQIDYDVELYGSEKRVELPFVMGVMADLAGNAERPPVAERAFLEIDVDNFDDRMKAMRPGAAFAVPNTLSGEGSLAVDLVFEGIEDFAPADVARRIPALATLLAARTRLAHLAAYMDGKAGAENLLAALLSDPAALAALAGSAPPAASTPVPADPAAADPDAALDALRALPRAASPASGPDAGAALDALRAMAPAPAAPAEDREAILRAIPAPAGPAGAPTTSADAALEALRALPRAAADEPDAAAAIEALRATAPAAPPPVDDLAAILAGVPAPAAAEATAPDLDALLAELGEGAEVAEEDDAEIDLDALLADIGGKPSASAGVADPAPGDFDLDALPGEVGGEVQAAEPPAAPAPEPEAAPRTLEDLFGRITTPRPAELEAPRDRFRIAVLGDFSGRALRGALESGDALAARKPVRLDIDALDAVIARFAGAFVLPLGEDGAGVEIRLEELDDLHPDALFEKTGLFAGLADLRRRVARGDAAALAEALGGMGDALPAPRPAGAPSDFQALIGRGVPAAAPAPVEALVRRVVAPHVRALPDARAASVLAAIDAAVAGGMRAILHHPDFQAIEAAWRSLELLARRVGGGGRVEIALYDVAAAEWAADLDAQPDLERSGLFRMLAEAPRMDAGQGPISAVFGLYTLAETPAHAGLAARMARIAAWMQASFVAAIAPDCLATPRADRPAPVRAAWEALRALPEAGRLALAAPGFLLRLPYGRKGEPVEAFDFEELPAGAAPAGMLWANPATLAAILMAETAARGGGMRLGEVMSLDGVPVHVTTDAHGDQVAAPGVERLLDTAETAEAVARGLLPVLGMKGRDVVRLGSFQALGAGELRGSWSAPTPMSAPPAAPAETSPVEAAPAQAAPAQAAPDQRSAEQAAPAEPTPAEPTLAEPDRAEGVASPASDLAAPEEAEGSDDELEALLRELEGAPEAAPDGDLDSELEALLKGL